MKSIKKKRTSIIALIILSTAFFAIFVWYSQFYKVKAHMNQPSYKISRASIAMKSFANSLELYNLDCGVYPNSQQGLNALIKKSEVPPDCREYNNLPPPYYNEESTIPKDPWGNSYQYISENGNSYEIISYGADGKIGGTGENSDLLYKSKAR